MQYTYKSTTFYIIECIVQAKDNLHFTINSEREAELTQYKCESTLHNVDSLFSQLKKIL